MQRLTNPVPLFLDSRGLLLDAGKIYIGEAGQDPENNPIDVYWDADLTIVAEQPLRTLGGVIVNEANPSAVYFDDGDYSYRVRDVDNDLVVSIPSAEDYFGTAGGGGASYQPLDSDLTTIAALTTTAYGRNLLTTANQAALKAATGIVDGLPLTGGTVTGTIVRGGAGVHPYFFDAAMTGGRIFITAEGEADPTSQPGDIWLVHS